MESRLKSFCIVVIIKNLPLLRVTVTGVNFIGMIVRHPFVPFWHPEWFRHFGIRFGFSITGVHFGFSISVSAE